MSKKPTHKLQAIIENKRPWPYIGNAYANGNGSLSIVLDRGMKLVFPDGGVLEAQEGGLPVKLYLKVANPGVAPAASEPGATEPTSA
jgi:hypothetical protein